MKTKKLLSILMALMMMLSVVPFYASAEAVALTTKNVTEWPTVTYLNPDGKMYFGQTVGEGIALTGGKVEYMETLFDAAKRELEEETSLVVSDLEIFSVSDDIKGEAHYVTIGFLTKKYTGEVKAMEPETILEWKWFDLDALPENMYMPSAKCIEKYKSGIIY